MCMKPSPTSEWFEFQNAHSHHNNIVQPAAGRTQYILYIYTIYIRWTQQVPVVNWRHSLLYDVLLLYVEHVV